MAFNLYEIEIKAHTMRIPDMEKEVPIEASGEPIKIKVLAQNADEATRTISRVLSKLVNEELSPKLSGR